MATRAKILTNFIELAKGERMSANAYFSRPSLHENTVVFVADDDIWKIELDPNTENPRRPTAMRLTNGRGRASSPKISPDGKQIAFVSNETGQNSLYVIPSTGGEYQLIPGTREPSIIGWHDDQTLVFNSLHATAFGTNPLGYKWNSKSEEFQIIPWGPMTAYSENESKDILIGRFNRDSAMWKRYRGGMAGTVWMRKGEKGNFKEVLKHLSSNITCPHIIDKKIYFVSDHEGVGNIYSSNLKGQNVKRHTHHNDYYVRNISTYENKISYQCGADIYILDIEKNETQKIKFDFYSNFVQAQKRFESADDYFQEYEMAPNAEAVILTTRGQVHVMPPWSGAPVRIGDNDSRYKNACWVISNKKENEYEILSFSQNAEHEETAVYLDEENFGFRKLKLDFDWGKTIAVAPSPTEEMAAITNNRNQLILLNTKSEKVQIIDDSIYGTIGNLNWSGDGRYLVYKKTIEMNMLAIWIYDSKTKETRQLLDPINSDFSPTFDPEGNYLYFLSVREYHPTFSETHRQLSFPQAIKPYVVLLREDVPSPFETHLDFEIDDEDDEDEEEGSTEDKKKSKDKKANKDTKKNSKDKKEEEDPHFKIDFENINHRILPFPVEIGGYSHIKAIKDKVFYLKGDNKANNPMVGEDEAWPTLKTFCFKDKKESDYQKSVGSYILSPNHKYIFMNTDDGMRLSQADHKPGDGVAFNKKDGLIDPERIKLSIDPRTEWKQMYQEAWVLQREHFWTEDMCKIDWEQIYVKYLPVLEKVSTRSEMGDLLWEMQGELGTSHCYEAGGDYNKRPSNQSKGMLGAEFEFHPQGPFFKIKSIHKGHSWEAQQTSPLLAPGVNLKEGDSIYAIDGRPLEHKAAIAEILQGRSSREISLTIKREKAKEKEQVTVKPISTISPILYREWVKKNRDYIHEKSKGKIGYVHVPNMSLFGYSEFYRQYLVEHQRDGLIIDVRFNGGGFVSQFLLRELVQKIIGYDQTRWNGVETYPLLAPRGVINCLTNESSGSDGDIFSHSFKLMGLGKLIGTRTWGGVIGIWPRNELNDQSWTSQPEFSFWFKDVGYGVENYGTDPDIEVHITPDDYKNERDPQLDRALKETLADMRKNPTKKPDLKKKPNLKIPKLPKI